MKSILGTLVVVLSLLLAGCSMFKSPTDPTPVPECPAGSEQQVEVVYNRPVSVPTNPHPMDFVWRKFGQGFSTATSTKIDDDTRTLTISFPENVTVGAKHVISASDLGFRRLDPPQPSMTGSGLTLNGVLLTDKVKEPHPDGGTMEYARFRVGCNGKVVP